MAKYIDAEHLRKEIERRRLSNRYIDTEGYEEELLEIIDSLQQEQPELPPIGYAETYYQKGLHDGIIKGQMKILKNVEEIEKRKAKPILAIKEQEQPEVDLNKNTMEKEFLVLKFYNIQ